MTSRPVAVQVALSRRSAPKDLEVLFDAAGATDAPLGAVKYMEFITYLWCLGEAGHVVFHLSFFSAG